MTGVLLGGSALGEALVGEALQAADNAARLAGVSVREIGQIAELETVVELYDGIWRRTSGPLLTAELLRALTKAGNYVVGAFDGDTLIGACVGFFCAPADSSLHSHIAGVSGTAQRRNVGYAMKLHQRAWTLERGVASIGWTFDPLVARNAWFNIVKLAASPVEYLPDFYGGMHDGINGADGSDRLHMQWDLGAPQVAAACAGDTHPGDVEALLRAGAQVALGISAAGAPLQHDIGELAAPTLLVAIPPDIERLRQVDPATASLWRAAVRVTVGDLFAAGARITGFDRSGWYIVQQDRTRPVAARTKGIQ
ncbi:MAG: GNAT family N-acetyltransferase [Actinomycetota bacterium]|nr:GNAT family N-acetyltransferase [Actinomycetota bacterium]